MCLDFVDGCSVWHSTLSVDYRYNGERVEQVGAARENCLDHGGSDDVEVQLLWCHTLNSGASRKSKPPYMRSGEDIQVVIVHVVTKGPYGHHFLIYPDGHADPYCCQPNQ
jgi:hypothetical protein